MKAYSQDVYRQLFVRLLARAMQQGKQDQQVALHWLERKYKLALAMLFTRHKLELADAYMDVRQHIQARVDGTEEG
ncbi:MAG TPA: hypothetical protein PLC52_08575 [Anaerolineales bacterium]|mgnify:CR=1 FL=1|nr:hypothetical protein [Anaerolineales bacterium]HRQ92904.1 hypothetical protein [Anaerolineales bacterium]